MEPFLKCYLDDFEKAPRNSLHDRRNRRQMVEYINTLIEGCSSAVHERDYETTCKTAVSTLIEYHETAKNRNGTVCMMGKYHNILYVAVKLCYLWQLKDADVVSKLLQEIYLCEGTFERIFIGAIFGTKAPHFIAGWKSDFDDQEDNVRGMVYFLDRAIQAKLIFPLAYKEKLIKFRFIDLPIESCGKASPLKLCVQMGLPDKILIFLRFGALTTNEIEENDLFEFVLDKLMEYKHCYPYNIVSCLELLLRVVPSLYLTTTQQIKDNISKNVFSILSDKYGDLIDDGLLPMSRCGYTTPELKHLCRCSVRKRLWENFQLPNGIRQLHLPEKLCRYIDILDD